MRAGSPSDALVTQPRPKLPLALGQFALRGHDCVDVLVRRRRLVAQVLQEPMIEPDAAQLSLQLAQS